MKYSIVLPTYNEAENIVPMLRAIRREIPHDLEILVVDDRSPDGTLAAAQREAEDSEPGTVRAFTNPGPRSLSASVIAGFDAAQGEYLLCMDADGQHRPQDIMKLFRALEEGADFAIGSRYIEGGGFAHKWNFFRLLTSKTATWMGQAALRVGVHDPMSGFFALRKEAYRSVRHAMTPSGTGFKIMLELLFLLSLRKKKPVVRECAIIFELRTRGESKLSGKVMLQYLKMLAACMKNRARLRAAVNAPGEEVR